MRLRTVLRKPGALAAAIFLGLVIVLSVIAPFTPLDPTAIDLDSMSSPPSAEHLFGTDALGRDYLARVVFGGRISLLVGFLAMAAATLIGTLVGLLAGYSHKFVDVALMRLVDLLSSIPWMVLIIVVSVFLKPGIITIIVVIGAFSWMSTARLVRAETLSVRERTFVQYASFIDLPKPRIVVRHILPQILPTIMVAATASLASAMMTEASLSFLGVGVQAPMASWGSLLQTAQGDLQRLPHLAVIPGLLIMATILSVSTLGNAVREAKDKESA
ncbi:MAG: ABC transporter permease [Propionibacteriaceae bacterium]|nr:ABC transporter permease [Propionibacteriaceae bacterium]